jgi:hypothetical protein
MLFTPYRRLAPWAWPERNWYGFWRVVTTSSPALVTAPGGVVLGVALSGAYLSTRSERGNNRYARPYPLSG